ncbi:MAG: hypothetical protein IJP81_04925, partial [Bacteroidales bacterium]|nr:hypothetical protein [Bacteroidales bacterium]
LTNCMTSSEKDIGTYGYVKTLSYSALSKKFRYLLSSDINLIEIVSLLASREYHRSGDINLRGTEARPNHPARCG